MLEHDATYLEDVKGLLQHGRKADTRNAVCLKENGSMRVYDLRIGHPLLLSKLVRHTSVHKELTWFNRGQTNIKDLGCGIWDTWADDEGECGPIYGEQWVAQTHVKVVKVSEIEKYQEAGYEFFGTAMLNEADCLEHFGEINLDEESIGVTQVEFEDGSELEYAFQMMRVKINQVQNAIDRLRKNPGDRRALVCAWNPGDLEFQALPPCHVMYQFMTLPMTVEERCAYIGRTARSLYEVGGGANLEHNHSYTEILHILLDERNVPKYYIDLAWYQRSCDELVGVPFNIASYAAQLVIVASELNMVPRKLIHFKGDYHIYENQLPHVGQQLAQAHELMVDATHAVDKSRFEYPTLRLKNVCKNFSEYTYEDFEVLNYNPKDAVPYPVTA